MAKLKETKDGNYFVYAPKLKVMRKSGKKGSFWTGLSNRMIIRF